MPTDDPSSHQLLVRYKIEAALLGLLAVAAFGGPFLAPYIEYVGGTRNSCGDGFLAIIFMCGLFVPVGAVFVLSAIIQLLLPPHTVRHMLLPLVFLIAPPVIIVGGFIGGLGIAPEPSAARFLRGFERWVLREVDTDAIQQWLATEGRGYADKGYGISQNFPRETPDFLVRFKPGSIRFRDSASGNGLCLEFGWGGGFVHWGLIVGLTDMPTPEEGWIDLGGSEIESRRPIKPGVYVFDRG